MNKSEQIAYEQGRLLIRESIAEGFAICVWRGDKAGAVAVDAFLGCGLSQAWAPPGTRGFRASGSPGMTDAARWLRVVEARCANRALVDDPVTRSILADAACVAQTTGFAARAWQFADGSWLLAGRGETRVVAQEGAR